MKIIIALLLVLAGCAPRHPPAGMTDREMFDAHAGAFWDLQRQAWPPVTNRDGTVTPDTSYWHENNGYEWLWVSERNDYVWTNTFPVAWTNRCGPWPLNAAPAGANNDPFQP